jgi:hypothetical protein
VVAATTLVVAVKALAATLVPAAKSVTRSVTLLSGVGTDLKKASHLKRGMSLLPWRHLQH